MLSIFLDGGQVHTPFGLQWEPACACNGAIDDRANTLFHLDTKSGSVKLVGTYDEILDLCTDIASAMMTWPIVNGKTDWFDSEEQAVIEGTGFNAGKDTRPDGRSSNGTSGDDPSESQAASAATPRQVD